MKRLPNCALLLSLALTACSGGGISSQEQLTPAVSDSHVAQNVLRPTEAEDDAVQQRLPLSVASSKDILYVGNVGNNSITVYRYDAAGNAAPIRTIAGSNTGIKNPGQLAQDAQGNLYVANSAGFHANGSPDPSAGILVFAPNANGNAAPLRRLAGPKTNLHYVEAMTVDQRSGKLFVFDEPSSFDEGESTYLRFPPNAIGDEAPFAVTPLGFDPAVELASDSTGQNIIEAHSAPCCSYFNFGVATLPKQFPTGTAPNTIYSTNAFLTHGVVDDPQTKTYLATGNNGTVSGIFRFAENTTGHFPYMGSPSTISPAVVSILTSDTCGSQLALGYLRSIYVSHTMLNHACPADAIYVYPHDASGNVSPLRILRGPATGLNEPYGVYEGK